MNSILTQRRATAGFSRCLECAARPTMPGRLTCSESCGERFHTRMRELQIAKQQAALRESNDAAWDAAGGSWD